MRAEERDNSKINVYNCKRDATDSDPRLIAFVVNTPASGFTDTDSD